MPFFRRLAIPFHGLLVVLGYASTLFVADAHGILCEDFIPLGRFELPFHGLLVVLGYPLPIVITIA